MASYYDTTKTKKFIAAYTCSRCGALNETMGVLNALGRAPFKKMSEKAANYILEKAELALANLHDKPFQVGDVEESRNESGFNTVEGYYFTGMDIPCPCCGNLELWQKNPKRKAGSYKTVWDGTIQRYTLPEVPEESRPNVFHSAEQYSQWKTLTLTMMAKKATERWEADPEGAQKVRDELASLDQQIQELAAQRGNVGAALNTLQAQLAAKTAEAKTFSLFSKERKAANGQIKELEKQITAQKTVDSQELLRIQTGISAMEQAKKDLLFANPGIEGKLQTDSYKGAELRTSYRCI